MTIVVDADRDQALRVEANLYKLVNVLFVENITGKSSDFPRPGDDQGLRHARHSDSDVLELANVFRARVVDVGPESLTIEITGPEAKIDGMLEVLRPYGIIEMVRTGVVAMRRGVTKLDEAAVTAAPESSAGTAASDDNVSYSV